MTRRRKEYVPGDVLPVRIRNEHIAQAVNRQPNVSAFVNDAINHYANIEHDQPSPSMTIDLDMLVAKLKPVINSIVEQALSGHTISHVDNQDGQQPHGSKQVDPEEIQNALDFLADFD